MPLFQCAKCGCVENTATSNYWTRGLGLPAGAPKPPPLCSECDPEIGKWHGRFAKHPATGLLLGNDGYLYSQEQVDAGQVKRIPGLQMVGKALDAYDRAAANWITGPTGAAPRKKLAELFRTTTDAGQYSDRFENAAWLWIPASVDAQASRDTLAAIFRAEVAREEAMLKAPTAVCPKCKGTKTIRVLGSGGDYEDWACPLCNLETQVQQVKERGRLPEI